MRFWSREVVSAGRIAAIFTLKLSHKRFRMLEQGDSSYCEDSMDAFDADVLCSPLPDFMNGIFGPQQIQPRVGDKYQVVIPPLMTDFCHQSDMQDALDASIPVQFCLSIPVVWINNVIRAEHVFIESPGESICANTIVSSSHEIVQMVTEDSTKLSGSLTDMDVPLPQGEIFTSEGGLHGFCPVPGSLGDKLTDLEEECFLLGLYIFGKNMVQIKKFIGSKAMGDVLSYYYGKFYGSCKHQQWLDSRKARTKKLVYGQRLFTGWRQQELISRLLLHILEEHKDKLMEVFKTFNEGKITFAELVMALRKMVGLNTLVEAIGIGKGKQDLGILTDPPKVSNLALRTEIPVGKACSSLSPADIIRYLTGDFRLSKARTSDIFWEAVWPRLLARGWHSEQPKCQGHTKQALVFLLPGVKKFSRKKLVRGRHYFDSVSDVLSKVASHPCLLELEAESISGEFGQKEDCHLNGKLCKIDSFSMSPHCYPQPKISSHSQELMKFTVVDTSLVCIGPHRIRELRSLPHSKNDCLSPLNCPSDNDKNSSNAQEQMDGNACMEGVYSPDIESEENSRDKRKTVQTVHDISQPCGSKTLFDGQLEIGALAAASQVEERDMECHFSDLAKLSQSYCFTPAAKRPKLKVFRRSNPVYTVAAEERKPSTPGLCTGAFLPTEVGILEQKTSTASSSKSSAGEASYCSLIHMEPYEEKYEARALIDLNLPHTPDFEAVERKESVSLTGKESKPDNRCESTNEPPISARRHSTRNRPLTTRALEALACGFLNTKRNVRNSRVARKTISMRQPSTKLTNSKCSRNALKLSGFPASMKEPMEGLDRSCSIHRDFGFTAETDDAYKLVDPVLPP